MLVHLFVDDFGKVGHELKDLHSLGRPLLGAALGQDVIPRSSGHGNTQVTGEHANYNIGNTI